MDAIKFIAERNRMCKSSVSCVGCTLSNKAVGLCIKWCFEHPEEAAAAVEQWANEHPRKTRQSEFLKQWPRAKMDKRHVLLIQPCDIDAIAYEDGGLNCDGSCDKCRREFWMQEVE